MPTYEAYRSTHGAGLPQAVRYLRSVLDRADDRAVGFKLMYGQARRHPVAWAYLVARRARIVHLVRENSLDVAISRQAAASTGRFHSAGEDDSDAAVLVDTRLLVRDIRDHQRHVAAARRLGRTGASPWLEVGYESLVTGGDRELRAVGEFLGIAIEPAEPAQDSLRRPGGVAGHRIANPQEVRAAVTAAGYGSLLVPR